MPKIENRRECASGRLAFTQCAQMGETENVSQQEYSTGHRPKLARQAASNAATENGETAVRQELIAHINCLIRRRARGTHAEEECGDSRGYYEYILVATHDVLSFALVTPESFPVESTRVFFLVSTV